MPRTITSANATLTLNAPGVFAVPQAIEQFSTDDAFDTENVAPNQAEKGVDGVASFGHTPYLVKQKVVLQANSPSNDVFDRIRQAEDADNETQSISMTLTVPSIGKIGNFINGALTGAMPAPPGKKVLGPQTYELTFDRLIVAPI